MKVKNCEEALSAHLANESYLCSPKSYALANWNGAPVETQTESMRITRNKKVCNYFMKMIIKDIQNHSLFLLCNEKWTVQISGEKSLWTKLEVWESSKHALSKHLLMTTKPIWIFKSLFWKKKFSIKGSMAWKSLLHNSHID